MGENADYYIIRRRAVPDVLLRVVEAAMGEGLAPPAAGAAAAQVGTGAAGQHSQDDDEQDPERHGGTSVVSVWNHYNPGRVDCKGKVFLV